MTSIALTGMFFHAHVAAHTIHSFKSPTKSARRIPDTKAEACAAVKAWCFHTACQAQSEHSHEPCVTGWLNQVRAVAGTG